MLNMLDLLESSERYRLSMLNIFDIRKNHFTTIDFLVQHLGISKFKVINLMDRLEQELAEYPHIQVIRQGKCNIQLKGLTSEVIRQLRLTYLKQSAIFNLLHESFTKEQSPEKYAQTHYISRSKAYVIKNELSLFLAPAGIRLREGRFLGREEVIRSVLFDVYNFYFNGLEYPFDSKNKKDTKWISTYFQAHLATSQVATRVVKLQIFLGINLQRLTQRCYIEPKNDNENWQLLSESYPEFDWSISFMKKSRLFPEKVVFPEAIWTFKFMLAEELLSLEKYPKFIAASVHELTKKQLYLFQISPELKLPNTGEKEMVLQELKGGLTLINFKILNDIYSYSTFVLMNQSPLVEENNVALHCLTENFVAEAKKSLTASDAINASTLYNDYVILLSTCVPSIYWANPFYLCIDFSRGDAYNRFIAQKIQLIVGVHLVVQTRVNQQTQLFLSDFPINGLRCAQVVWTNPPMDNDWIALLAAINRLKAKNV